ncbi:DUF31 family putative serine protease [Mycoplasmoides pneumoniae]|uniref:Uncharacterized protein MPN_589 n=2 Tax=Mycoplasmoides pneumoniae TaxID=2104 RepID=Y589_MYCPN|nr:hypothetical protein [Mycoplasmoides pneumoniae]Q50338.1 RecName: Full=Uncharacterized protein MPN_589 [Mycoplasmoides pneumoniae M129]AAB95901.1 conserved hypothetical protein [Mycoplasmoides pneumoniae M129]AAC43667.1 D02_orf157L [Mycoplasmoides pneumoniae]ALX06885.1 hypothetical protein AVK85_03285 [Mycoplasmoides pneumoniae]AMF84727.1 hypothetical protein AXA72_03395 [Mycoplasmoides pneumoniae]ARI11919.1 hypothetical protein B7R95_03450 [Mycoplasmoides pneumoniae]
MGYPTLWTDDAKLFEWTKTEQRFNHDDFYGSMPTLTKNLRQGQPVAGSKVHTDYSNGFLNEYSLNQGIVDFGTFKSAITDYHGYEYKNHGYGLALTDTDLLGGSSGSLVFNQDKKISSIYSAATESDSVGYAQLLPVPKDVNGVSLVKYSYDLILWW